MMVCMADMEHLDCTARERQLRERPLCRFVWNGVMLLGPLSSRAAMTVARS